MLQTSGSTDAQLTSTGTPGSSPTPHPTPRPAARPRSFQRILLATDFTDASEPATRQALSLAAALGASLVAVTVVDPRRLRVGGRPARVDQVRAEREGSMSGLVRDARSRDLAFEFLVWVGEPGEAILEAAQSEGADRIVVGSHGRGRVGRILIGSVSDEVVRNATVPVLVVGPSA
jgi:nucleotide-binding universal stress UspA family protein